MGKIKLEKDLTRPVYQMCLWTVRDWPRMKSNKAFYNKQLSGLERALSCVPNECKPFILDHIIKHKNFPEDRRRELARLEDNFIYCVAAFVWGFKIAL